MRIATRTLEAVAEDDQEPDLRQVLRRQGLNVHSEVGNHVRRLEDGLQPLFNVTGFMRLVADQNQRVRAGVGRSRGVALERGDRDGQFAVDVFKIVGGRGIVGHPDEAVGGEPDLVAKVGEGSTLSDVITDLATEFSQEPSLTGEELGTTPGAKSGDDSRRCKRLQPAQ
jgi:hypothetical protein